MILVLILVIFSISIVVFSLYTGISPMPSSRAARKGILALLPSGVSTVYDLGSGWGGLLFFLARHRPETLFEGYEISWLPWLYSLLMAKIFRLSNVRLYRKNFYQLSLSGADALVCYLYPGAMKKLEPQIDRQLKAGGILISSTFSLPKWSPSQTVVIKDFWKSTIYLYKKPEASQRPQ